MNSRGTPISWPLRFWLAVEVLFGVVAVMSVFLAPAESKTNFAWPVQPVVMAAVLGAFYFSSAPLFVLAVCAKQWEKIRVIILPAAIFTAVQLVVTFLHWEKFTVGSTPFWVWFASYLLPPPILLAAYWWHQRRALAGAGDDPIPPGLKSLAQSLGVLFAAGGTLTFVMPTLLMPHFPWKLTPLTTRSMSGWLILLGVLLLAIARDGDRTRTRLASPMLVLCLPALLFQMRRFRGDVDWSHPTLWVGLTLFALVAGCGLVLARGSWKSALR